MSKSILIINYEFFPLGGGGSTVCYYLAKNLVQAGYQVEIITSHYRGLPRQEVLEGIKIHRIPVIRKRLDFCSVPEMATFVLSGSYHTLKILKDARPDLIQVFFSVPSGPVAYLAHKIHQIPYLVYSGGADMPGGDPRRFGWLYPLVTPFIRKIWQHSQMLITASQNLKELALRTYPQAKIQVISNGVDLERFRPLENKPQKDKIRILGIGRLISRKGFHFLIEALPQVVKEAKFPLEVEIVGSGQEEESLKNLAQQLGVRDILNFVGQLPYEGLLSKYQQADIFVLPSLSEGMPCVMLEAMACGLPVVASDIGGNEELVYPGQNGYLFSAGHSQGLAESLIKIINHPALRKKMGQESLRIIQDYDWSKITEKYIAIYQEIFNTRPKN